MSKDLINAIVEMQEVDAIRMSKELLDGDISPNEILNIGVEAMGIIGDRFEAGDYFLPELLMAGEIMEAINELALPMMGGSDAEAKGEKIVLGTVSGDVHDIGKNIVRFMLEANGYSVVDLGTDIPAETFVNAVIESGAAFVGLSALLTVSYDAMKETVEALENAGLRDKTKVMVGGAPVDDKVLEYVNADARGGTAVAAVHLVNGWIEGKES